MRDENNDKENWKKMNAQKKELFEQRESLKSAKSSLVTTDIMLFSACFISAACGSIVLAVICAVTSIIIIPIVTAFFNHQLAEVEAKLNE